MNVLIIDILGWLAAALILGAYALLSTGRLAADSTVYQALNVAGAAGFIANSGWYGAWPSAMLNVAWLAIGTYALVRLRRQASGSPQSR